MIIWFTGNSGAGKTYLAERIQLPNKVILDGDKLRRCWTLGFSKEDRWEQNMRAAKLGLMLQEQGFNVVISTICPYRELRDQIRKLTGCKFVYVEGGKDPNETFPYEKD